MVSRRSTPATAVAGAPTTTTTRTSSTTCASAGRVTAQLFLSFLALSAYPAAAAAAAQPGNNQVQAILDGSPIVPPLIPEPVQPADHTFTLRHILHHGTYRHPGLHRRQDITHPDAEVWLARDDDFDAERVMPLKAKSRPKRIERLTDRRPAVIDPMVAQARERGYVLAGMPSAWTIDDVPGPDITDKETVLSMALVAANAYVEKTGMPDWEEVGEPFNRSADFGWETDGLRGHIWADQTNSTIIIGLKGTSPAVFDGSGTTTNDKENDNLFFSCCCAQQGQWSWHQVCDCATGTYSCNNTCVTQALRAENRYYQAARELYSNVTELYQDSNIWVVGHSLGGAVSSLLGLTYGLPVVTFEAVPEAMAAGRLGLPVPPHADPQYPQTREFTGAYHFGHTADPIFVGSCNGATATCSFAGYAMESACHTGYECTYDTVGDKGWRVGIGTHKIRSVINDVIKKYDEVPQCKFTPECRDCANWKMYESNSTNPITTTSSSTSSLTRTRTATCKTPGWWGCLDETTSTGTETSTSTTSSSTSTCKTPGWFGCNDKTTTTTTTTTTPSTTTTTSTTTTCKTPGWFGCNDPTMTVTQTQSPSSTTTCKTPGWLGCNDATTTSSATSTTTCKTPGVFYGCKDATSTTPLHSITSPPPMPTASAPSEPTTSSQSAGSGRCLQRYWFGLCKVRDGDVSNGPRTDEI